MAAYLSRIDAINPRLNAIVSLRPAEALLAEADAADRALAAGDYRGWLHGVPFAVKDLSEAKGILCSFGSANYADFVPDYDDIHVERIRAAGAIVIGKTNAPEMGLGSHSYNPVFGVTRNPYDTGKSAGGSSGGAAAALAARLLPVADGSDMMGSLRNPAGFNNVVGFRPSFGRVPSLGTELFLGQLAVNGPMGRSVADVAALLATQAGHDPRDPLSLADDGSLAARRRAAIFPALRIGWLGDFGGYLAVRARRAGALPRRRSTSSAGSAARVEDVRAGLRHGAALADLAHAAPLPRRQWAGGRLCRPHPARRANMKPEMIWEIENGRRTYPRRRSMPPRSAAATGMRHVIGPLRDATISSSCPPPRSSPSRPSSTGRRRSTGRAMDTYHRWMEVVIGPTLAGLPVAAMPAGFGVQTACPQASRSSAARGPIATCSRLPRAYEAGHRLARPVIPSSSDTDGF
jgi:amidase